MNFIVEKKETHVGYVAVEAKDEEEAIKLAKEFDEEEIDWDSDQHEVVYSPSISE